MSSSEEDRSEDKRWGGYKSTFSAASSTVDDDGDSSSDTATDGIVGLSDSDSEPTDRRNAGRERDHGDTTSRRPTTGTREQSNTLGRRTSEPHGNLLDANSLFNERYRGSRNRETANLRRRTTDRRETANTLIRPPVLPAATTRRESVPPNELNRFGRSYVGAAHLKPEALRQIANPAEFTLTLPEDPYNVRTIETTTHVFSPRTIQDYPDQPFLQFYTWRTYFHVMRSATENGAVGNPPEPAEPLCRCHIADRRGDKCGSIVIDSTWLSQQEANMRTGFEFIAISDAKSFTEEEFPDWTYYIPKERIDSEWDLYFVLLVEAFPEEGIYRRVALGKVFKAAFEHSAQEWQEIILG